MIQPIERAVYTICTLNNDTIRKNFFADDDPTQPIYAAGVLFYRNINNDIDFLMIKTRRRKSYNDTDEPPKIVYEDFGGCIDMNDVDVYHTIAREAQEESNNVFNADELYDLIVKSPHKFYSHKSKYLLTLVKLTSEYDNIDLSKFGSHEYHDNIPRTVHWINRELFRDKQFVSALVNFRIRSFDFFTNVLSSDFQ